MKTEKNILIAFLLNLAFSIFEFIGGVLTGSVAIISDAVHDLGDAASIGAAFFLEKKSNKQPDEHFTYGYARYSVIGSVITMATSSVLPAIYEKVGFNETKLAELLPEIIAQEDAELLLEEETDAEVLDSTLAELGIPPLHVVRMLDEYENEGY